MDREPAHARRADLGDKVRQDVIGVLFINADTAFDRHLDRTGRAHGRNTLSHQIGRLHQNRAKSARLNTIRRATAVQVHLVIAIVRRNLCRLGQFSGIRSPQLDSDGMFGRIKPQQTITVPVNNSGRCHHFGIQQRLTAHQTMKVPTMTVGPIHHRGDGQFGVIIEVHSGNRDPSGGVRDMYIANAAEARMGQAATLRALVRAASTCQPTITTASAIPTHITGAVFQRINTAANRRSTISGVLSRARSNRASDEAKR